MQLNNIIQKQRHYFYILEDFFKQATGKTCTSFSPLSEFASTVRRNAIDLGPRLSSAFPHVCKQLANIYSDTSFNYFDEIKNIHGIKLLTGGSSYFLESHLKATQKTLLYAETILIPDPVMPWLEMERSAEKFPHVNLLQAVFFLLHLKPLVDANMEYPPIIVFPSWGKTLEEKDEKTRNGILQLTTDVIEFHAQKGLNDIDSVKRFAINNPNEFLELIDKNSLYIAPGGSAREPLKSAINRYKEEIKQWRTNNHIKITESLPESLFVLNGITERIAPQYHLIENAEETSSTPMLCIDAQYGLRSFNRNRYA